MTSNNEFKMRVIVPLVFRYRSTGYQGILILVNGLSVCFSLSDNTEIM
jgi:hypothetical protein